MLRKLGKRLADIRGLLDRLDASMVSVNEGVNPEPSRLEPFLPTVSRPSPSVTQKPICQRSNAWHHPHMSPAAAADIDLLFGSADGPGSFLPPDRALSTTGGRNTGGDAVSASAVLRHNTALQAGQLRWNVEHFSATLAADQGRRVAEKVGANQEVMERERLCDRRWKALRTTCLAISNIVIAIAFLVMLFIIRFT
ncbi:hypothetical protein EDB85DRAFT_1898045 [Lactarius pseudohatsudake]|nr:hypothetical protein EDB85DRAFT_1898045 [Lactarius pseudohatsudake]